VINPYAKLKFFKFNNSLMIVKELTMLRDIPERDWKYMRSIEKELLGKLCARINKGSEEILQDVTLSDFDKYISNFKYIQASDQIVADCFDDWRRSKLIFRLLAIYRQGLMTEDEISKLTEETQARLKLVRD